MKMPQGWRRERDLNPRVHRNTGLCDLGSETATCESDIRLTRPQGGVRIAVEHHGLVNFVDSDEPISISDVLSRLEIHPSTVLAVHDGTIVPHTSVISDDLAIELVIVSSGG